MNEMAYRRVRNNRINLYKSKTFKNAIMWVVLGFFLFYTIAPLVWLVISSLKTNGELMGAPLALPKTLQSQNYKNAFVMYDTNILETHFSEVGNQSDGIIDYLKNDDISYNILKYKVDNKKSIMGKMLNKTKGENNYQYKIAFVISNDNFNDIIKLHLKYHTNLRFGLNFINENISQSEKDFISNMINDENRFDYYDIDVFYNYDLKRIALFSKDEKSIKNIIDLYKE